MDAMPIEEREAWLAGWVEETRAFGSKFYDPAVWSLEEVRATYIVPEDAPVRDWVRGQRIWMDGAIRPPRTPSGFNDMLAWIKKKDLWFLGVEDVD